MNTKDKRRLWWREHKRKQAADRATAKLESQQFAMLPIPMLRSPAWRVLSRPARVLLDRLAVAGGDWTLDNERC